MRGAIHPKVEALIETWDLYIGVRRVWLCHDEDPATSVLIQVRDNDSSDEWWVYLDDEDRVMYFRDNELFQNGHPPFVAGWMQEMGTPVSALSEPLPPV